MDFEKFTGHLADKVGAKFKDCMSSIDRDIENSIVRGNYFEELPSNIWQKAKDKASLHFDRLMKFLTDTV